MAPRSSTPAGRPLRAVAAGSGKHLFDHVNDPRVMFTPVGSAFEGEADLIVVPCGSSYKVAIAEKELPESVWQAAREGRAIVVLDASTEGSRHDEERTADLHGFLAHKGVAADQAVYLTQDRDYRRQYLAFCARSAIGPTMAVVLNDYFIWKVSAQLQAAGEAMFAERLQRFRARAASRSRRFVSLNFTPRPHKVLFLMSLMRDELWGQGHISFGGFDKLKKTRESGLAKYRRHLYAPPFEDLAAELDPWLEPLDAYGLVMLGAPRRVHSDALVKDDELPEFDDSWFSIVTETEMLPSATRITEKPLKPLSNFHPLVSFGNFGALRMIRELGFSTFGEVINEAYDEEPDPRRRFELVYSEVRRLCALDEGELARLAGAVADKLEHNARHALVDMPNVQLRRHGAELIDRILDAACQEAREARTG